MTRIYLESLAKRTRDRPCRRQRFGPILRRLSMTTITHASRVLRYTRSALRALPDMLTTRRNRVVVLALQCSICGAWVPPRQYRMPAMACSACHNGPASRVWTRGGTR